MMTLDKNVFQEKLENAGFTKDQVTALISCFRQWEPEHNVTRNDLIQMMREIDGRATNHRHQTVNWQNVFIRLATIIIIFCLIFIMVKFS